MATLKALPQSAVPMASHLLDQFTPCKGVTQDLGNKKLQKEHF